MKNTVQAGKKIIDIQYNRIFEKVKDIRQNFPKLWK